MKTIAIKRIYDEPSAADDYRILVDRLWPRGISKESARLNEWLKELAPSDSLRKWFNHQVELYPEFKKRYLAELESQKTILQHIIDLSNQHCVTLLYGAKDTEHNQAVVLLERLLELQTH